MPRTARVVIEGVPYHVTQSGNRRHVKGVCPHLPEENVVRIYGSEGWILVPNPWLCGKDETGANIIVHKAGIEEPERISVPEAGGLYAIEADTVAVAIAKGAKEPDSPAMTWDDTLGNMRTLEAWIAELE